MLNRLFILVFFLASHLLLANTSPEGIGFTENVPQVNTCNLPAPSNLVVDGVTPTSLAFGWSPVLGTNGYGVQLINMSTGDPVYNDQIFTEWVNITGLTPNTLYRFDVWTICPITGEQGGTSFIYGITDFVVIDDIFINFQLHEPTYIPGNNFRLFDGTFTQEPSKYFEARNVVTGQTIVFEAAKELTNRSEDVVSHHVVFKNENGEVRDPYKWVFDVDRITPFCPDLCREEGHYAYIKHSINDELVPVIVMITPRGDGGFTSLYWESIHPDYEIRKIGPSERSVNSSASGINQPAVVVQPNPFTDRMILRQHDFFGEQESCSVTLLNPYTGATMRTYQWSAGADLIIPTADLLPGAYLLRFETAGRTEVIKVIKSF